MRHAETFAECVKELNGEPVTGHDGKIVKGQSASEIFPFDASEEDNAIDAYNQFALVCRENGDSISMKIFEVIFCDNFGVVAVMDGRSAIPEC